MILYKNFNIYFFPSIQTVYICLKIYFKQCGEVIYEGFWNKLDTYHWKGS